MSDDQHQALNPLKFHPKERDAVPIPFFEWFAVATIIAGVFYYTTNLYLRIIMTVLTGLSLYWLFRSYHWKRRGVGKQRIAQSMEYYGLTKLGFLPTEPNKYLPEDYALWEELSRRLPELFRSGTIRQTIHSMKPLTNEVIENLAEDVCFVRRAYVLFGQLVHAYVHVDSSKRDDGVEEAPIETNERGLPIVPHQIAMPLYCCAKMLGMKPVLTASGTDLWNFALNSGGSNPPTMKNTHLLSSITGTDAEKYFHLLPAALQAVAGSTIPLVLRIPELIQTEDYEELTRVMVRLRRMFEEFSSQFSTIHEFVDPDVFFEVYRPLLAGFHPEGVVFRLQSIDQKSTRDVHVVAKGSSAGQSAMFVLFDEALRVKHVEGKESMKEFQEEMVQDYMPDTHKRLIRDFAEAMAENDELYVVMKRKDPLLQRSYDDAVKALVNFRKLHLSLAKKYLAKARVGTGASSFEVLLKQGADATVRATQKGR